MTALLSISLHGTGYTQLHISKIDIVLK